MPINQLDQHLRSARLHRYRILRRGLFLGSLLAAFICALLLVRYLSWTCLGSLSDSASRLGIPTILAAALALIGAFVDIGEYNKKFRTWVTKEIEETRFAYYAFATTAAALIFILVLCSFTCPRKWSQFIDNDFLGGEGDGYHAASITVETQIKPLDAAKADLMNDCLKVFQTRAKKNLKDDDQSAGVKDILVRLEQVTSSDEFLEPFLLFGIAEGYSVLGEVNKNPAYFATSRAQYKRFLDRKLKTITSQWRSSAIQNVGNTYFYEGNYNSAIMVWKTVPENPNTDGNIVAAYVETGEFAKAVDWANKGLAHKEPRFAKARSSLTENEMIALMAEGKPLDAINVFKSSEFSNRVPGVSLEATVCLAYLMAGDKTSYKSVLPSIDQSRSKEILECIDALQRGEHVNAVKHLQETFGSSHSEEELWNDLINGLTDNGYFAIPTVRTLVLSAQTSKVK